MKCFFVFKVGDESASFFKIIIFNFFQTFEEKWKFCAVKKEQQKVRKTYHVIFTAWTLKSESFRAGEYKVALEIIDFTGRKMPTIFVNIRCGISKIYQHDRFFVFFHDNILQLNVIVDISRIMNNLKCSN